MHISEVFYRSINCTPTPTPITHEKCHFPAPVSAPPSYLWRYDSLKTSLQVLGGWPTVSLWPQENSCDTTRKYANGSGPSRLVSGEAVVGASFEGPSGTGRTQTANWDTAIVSSRFQCPLPGATFHHRHMARHTASSVV